MAMIDMQLDRKDAQEEAGAYPTDKLPKYPYGLCIYLDDENTSSSVDLQITAMELAAAQPAQSAASVLYGG